MVRSMEPQNNGRILAAELVGTLVLMLGGPGVAILLPALGLLPEGDATTAAGLLKLLIISLGFGFSLLIMCYVIGPISALALGAPAVESVVEARKTTQRSAHVVARAGSRQLHDRVVAHERLLAAVIAGAIIDASSLPRAAATPPSAVSAWFSSTSIPA